MEKIADSFEVSRLQEALWRLEPAGPSARVQMLVSLDGALDEARLRAALAEVVQRHEILRTTFAHQPGLRVPVQVVQPSAAPAWETVELRGSLDELRRRELATALDLESGPLVRAVLARLAADRHALILTLSGLCADAASAALLARELLELYGEQTLAVAEPLQYADFAAWQRELGEDGEGEHATAARAWRERSELTAPALPFARPVAAPGPPEQMPVALASDVAARLAEQAGRYGASRSALVQAAWYALAARLSGEETVALSYLPGERRHEDLTGALGAFAGPVPVAVAAGEKVTVAELLRELQRGRDEALMLADHLPLEGARHPAVAFVEHEGLELATGDLTASAGPVALSGLDLTLWLTCADISAQAHPALSLSLGFDPAAFDPAVVALMARELAQVLEGVAADAGVTVGELELLDPGLREQILRDFNDTSASVPDRCLHELFAAHAASAPTRAAVREGERSITYRELDARANQLAHRLRRAGVGPDVAVGLCTERTIEMVVGLLGILKAGGAYVPLHHEHPPARLGHQLATAGARAIVTQQSLLDHLPAFEGEIIALDRDRDALSAEPAHAPDVQVSPADLAYVIYTSGSTGTPKGVGVTHGNLVNYAAAITARLDADIEPLSFGLVTSISTDLGNTSVYGALASGGTLVLISPVIAADAGALVAALQTTPVDVLKITPSHIGALLAAGDAGVLPRRTLVLGGERAPWDLIERVRTLNPGLAILNHYGPTEATIGACTFPVGEDRGAWEPATVPIGRPISNTACYVLDVRSRPVPIGVAGQLFISGAGVARGYVGQPELTAERFLEDPFAAGRRMYDTGDVARWLPDGTLEFLGRADEQVKIRGYRVEPAEVETALRTHPRVSEAVVLVETGPAGDHRLAAYCVAQDAVSEAALHDHLAAWLPEFMLPWAIVRLDAFPVTASGKVDRLALPAPGATQDAHAFVAPRTPMEETVAAIWSRVLSVEQVGVDEDFFALGGHSLLATQVVAQVRSDFAVDLPLHSLFSYPTVESLTAEILRMMGESEEDETARLLAELEDLSDEDAERLLAGEESG